MKIKDLDKNHATGATPLQCVMTWLRSAINSPACQWDADQKLAAREALVDAHELLDRDILPLATHEVHPIGTAVELAALRAQVAQLQTWRAAVEDSPLMLGGIKA